MSKICKLLMSILLISMLASTLVIHNVGAKPTDTQYQQTTPNLTVEEIKILKELIKEGKPIIPPELNLNLTERMIRAKVPTKLIPTYSNNILPKSTSKPNMSEIPAFVGYTNPTSGISLQNGWFSRDIGTNDFTDWGWFSFYLEQNSWVYVDYSGNVGNFKIYADWILNIDDSQYSSWGYNQWDCRDTGWFSTQGVCDQATQRSTIFYLTKGWHTANVEGYALRFGSNPTYWVNGAISVIAFPEYTALKINSPNGGENWGRGTTKTISWNIYGRPATNVKIELYKGSTLSTVITSKTSNDGSYSWYIPTYQPTGSDYKIKITSIEEPIYTDWSDKYFNIISI